MIKSTVKYVIIATMNLYKTLVPQKIEFYVKALAILFAISSLIGFATAELFPIETEKAIEQTKEEFIFIEDMNQIEIFLLIFLNNSIKVFFMMLLGILFGVIPVIFILLNGYVVGIVVSGMIEKIGVISILIGILPHGIFEIPAVLIAGGYGVWLGEMFSKKLKNKTSLMPTLKTVLKKYTYVIMPMILLAAIIETFITEKLLTIFLI